MAVESQQIRRATQAWRDPETGAALSWRSFNTITTFILPSYTSLTHIEFFFLQLIKTSLLL